MTQGKTAETLDAQCNTLIDAARNNQQWHPVILSIIDELLADAEKSDALRGGVACLRRRVSSAFLWNRGRRSGA